jgi:hypothetical protein
MAIVTMDGLVAALAASQFVDTYEASITSQAAGSFASLWTAGGHPAAGATPASVGGAIPTSATAGAIPFTNPTGGNTLYLARGMASSANTNSIILIDRLVHTAGLSGTSTSAQTVGTGTITRTYNAGTNVSCWIEVYTQLGATGVTATVSYTNQSGTSGKSGSAAIPATAKVGCVIPVSLASGDTGVQSVQTVTLSASTGTAGSFGVTLAQRICTFPVIAALGQIMDYAQLSLPVIQPSACLSYYVLCSTTTTGTIISELTFAQG